jgi:Fe-S-cluster containining protein
MTPKNDSPTIAVPCGKCRACCRHQFVVLFPEHGDDVTSYEHEEAMLQGGGIVNILATREDGACVYLDEATGCTIHERAPAVCRAFDCRRFFLGQTRAERRLAERNHKGKSAIFAAGRTRLATLTPQEHDAALKRRSKAGGVFIGDTMALAED